MGGVSLLKIPQSFRVKTGRLPPTLDPLWRQDPIGTGGSRLNYSATRPAIGLMGILGTGPDKVLSSPI